MELEVLLEGMRALTSSLDVETVLASIVQQLARALQVDRCVLFTYTPDVERLDMAAVYDERGPQYACRVFDLHLDDYPQMRAVVEHGAVLAVTNAQGPDVDPDTRAACRDLGVRSLLFLPLRYGDITLGVVGLDELRRQRTFAAYEIEFCQGLSNQAAAALWQARIFAEMQHEREQLRAANQRQQHLLDLVQTLSTPVVPIFEGIVVLPLVGLVDAQRARQLEETLLTAIVRERARIIVIDITGVSVVDEGVAQGLIQALTAARLLGAEGIIAGIRPEVAQIIVSLGIRLDGVLTAPDLRRAIEIALRRLGRRIVTA